MSEEYLEEIFQDFSSPQGTTRILCATSGASTVSRASKIQCSRETGQTQPGT